VQRTRDRAGRVVYGIGVHEKRAGQLPGGAGERAEEFFSPAVTAVLVQDYIRSLQSRGLSDSYGLLTDREKEVLQLLAEGRSNKEVATLLNVAVSTIETHRASLMQKLNLHNTAEIVLYAVRKGIIV
jgi:two-component system, NarL family, response regulator NreC